MNVSSSIRILSEMCAFLPPSSLGTSLAETNRPPYSVIGLSDGLTVPFALTAGLSSLGNSKLVVLGGIAELIAGAISMGIGGFLASQAERDYYRYQRKSTAARVKRSCDGEIQREVVEVLGPVGVDEKTCSLVAKCLLDLELESEGHGSDSRPSSIEDGGLKWSKDIGVTAFLIKFGEGLGASSPSNGDVVNSSLPRFYTLQRRSQTSECTCLHSPSVSVTWPAASSPYSPISSFRRPSRLLSTRAS